MILRKKVPYYLHEILRYLCKPKCFKKYQRLQFYVPYLPILDETPYIVSLILWATLENFCKRLRKAWKKSKLKLCSVQFCNSHKFSYKYIFHWHSERNFQYSLWIYKSTDFILAQYFCKRSRSWFRLKKIDPESGSFLIG